jgi:hypothetical protein
VGARKRGDPVNFTETIKAVKKARPLADKIRAAYPRSTDKELFQILVTFLAHEDLGARLMAHLSEEGRDVDPDPST